MAVKKEEGLNTNSQAALAYLLGPITGVVFFIIGKDKFVKFHAMQSIVVFTALFLLQMVMGITIVLALFIPIVMLVGFILWLLLIYKAWQGEEWEVPFLGKYVRQLLAKVK